MMNNRSKVITQLSKNEISRVSGGQECRCWCVDEYMFTVSSPNNCKIICNLEKPQDFNCYVWDEHGREHNLAKPLRTKGSKYPQYLPVIHTGLTTAMGSLSLNPRT